MSKDRDLDFNLLTKLLFWRFSTDKYFMKTCPAKKDDYFEFFAEIDLLCALSTCPGGDLSTPMWGESSDGTTSQDQDPTLECCRPLRVEVWSIPEKTLVEGKWKSPEPLGTLYKGMHGMRRELKSWEK